MSLRASSASRTVISLFSRLLSATSLFRAPSSSRIFDLMFIAMYLITSLSISYPSFSSFLWRIAIRVSKSGEEISAISPHSNRERSLASSVSISFGGLSEEIMICFLFPCRSLNVWKNSSCVASFPIINWISSIRRTSTLRYFSRNFVIAVVFPLRIESISSFVKVSLVTYKTLFSGFCWRTKWAIECIRCVFPSPAPPWINRGLYIFPGDSATASAAAWANLLLFPTTKVSNVYFGFRFAFSALELLSIRLTEENFFLLSNFLACSGRIKEISYSLPISSAIATLIGNIYFFVI